jgi:ribokinase
MVTVVGSLNLDLFIEAPRLPAPGETVRSQRFRQESGGKGANQAVAAARLGASVAMLGAVGRDAAGTRLVEALRATGVDVTGVAYNEHAPTGTAFIIVDAAGQNQIVVAAGANDLIGAEHLDQHANLFESTKAVLTQLEIPLATVAAALRLARVHGALAILNPAPARPLADELLQACDWIIPNQHEAAALAGLPDGSSPSPGPVAARLRERGGGAGVAITLGPSGVWLECGAFSGLVNGFPVTAVDTVGAGDTFNGAFAVKLTEGAEPVEAARFACAAAALSVTRRGAQASAPTRTEVDAFLKQHAMG